MKCVIPEISWHNRDPVLSVDFQLTDDVYRVATGGTDSHVLIWLITISDNGNPNVEFVADLVRHNRAVNAVRFSPNGEVLASGDDEAVIWLWKRSPKDLVSAEFFEDDSEKENKENWTAFRTLRGHIEDVEDLCWSPCSSFLISGSIDNSAIMWDTQKGKSLGILSDHKGFVQGVAWDPRNQYVATLSSDRFCRVYSINNKRVVHRSSKMVLPSSVQSGENPKSTKMFHDDTLKTFCRRLTFTPDGELLIAPSGILEIDDQIINTTYVFSRQNLSKPVLYLPSKDKYTVAVRCCPVIFELRQTPRTDAATKTDSTLQVPKTDNNNSASSNETENTEKPWEKYASVFSLPYRVVFAVATRDSVLLYDTQQPIPFGHISNIHYTRLTDLAWSKDGRILIISSTDGYCSVATFGPEELGVPYEGPTKPPTPQPIPKSASPKTVLPIPKTASPKISSLIAKSSSPKINLPMDPKLTPVAAKVSSPATVSPAVVKTGAESVEKKPKKKVQLITLFMPNASKSATKQAEQEPKPEISAVNKDPAASTPDVSATLLTTTQEVANQIAELKVEANEASTKLEHSQSEKSSDDAQPMEIDSSESSVKKLASNDEASKTVPVITIDDDSNDLQNKLSPENAPVGTATVGETGEIEPKPDSQEKISASKPINNRPPRRVSIITLSQAKKTESETSDPK